MAKIHELKTWIEYYCKVRTGEKTFEVRKDDRKFMVGDTLVLREWSNRYQTYTGRMIKKEVTYKLYGGEFGIEKGFCVLGIK